MVKADPEAALRAHLAQGKRLAAAVFDPQPLDGPALPLLVDSPIPRGENVSEGMRGEHCLPSLSIGDGSDDEPRSGCLRHRFARRLRLPHAGRRRHGFRPGASWRHGSSSLGATSTSGGFRIYGWRSGMQISRLSGDVPADRRRGIATSLMLARGNPLPTRRCAAPDRHQEQIARRCQMSRKDDQGRAGDAPPSDQRVDQH